jgi:heme/copper-type cytochrome/quinol oxidase subunit 4
MIRSMVSVWLLLGAGLAYAAGSADEPGSYRMVLFLHQVLFVFWLGPDIGVYMWGTKAGNPELSVAQRVAAARIMRVIDVLPKVCMSLMLTVGGLLTDMKGIPHPWWQMVGIVVLGPVWLTLTLLTFARSGTDAGKKFAVMDERFRWVVIATVVLSVIFSTVTDRLTEFPWVSAKLLIFAAVVLFGVLIRRRLEPFNSAIEQVEGQEISAEVNATLARSLSSSRPFIIASWVALAAAAWLGMVQPGGSAVESTPTALNQSL